MKTSKILENIRNQIGEENLFKGNLLEEGKCSADLTDVSEDDRVVIDLDKLFPGGRQGKKQCECVLFYFNEVGSFVVVLIELKGGRKSEVSEAVKQLKSGANFAATHTPHGFNNICCPVLFLKRPSTAIFRRLKNPESKVCFDGKPFEIKTARCGEKLANALS